ncbi:MAG: PSD1 and planctomycete cytochrome C domain-containing protein [Acidobacteriota bacterium]|nr:PSD1 and planctomycete cytochrome C domain-containing protein [Acidobacteriota bacterium]
MPDIRLLTTFLILSLGRTFASPSETAEFFEAKIRPILANRCYSCHSETAMGGLAMNTRAGILKGGKSGPGVVPGKPDESLIIRAVQHADEKMKMPMGQPKLPDFEVELLASWVKAGAVWPEESPKDATKVSAPKSRYAITPEQRAFWAFQPAAKPAIPAVVNNGWAKSDIDRFILEKLDAKKLKPNQPANARDLLRRAYLDLTGLPPTYEQTEAFVKDTSPDAFAKVVDRLLASPRYGERWGRFWLDVARYSDDRLDSDVELPYPNSFRYRDWVIKAFNDDMPYNTFVKAQIAGDLLTEGKEKQLAVGLGFYGLSPELTDDRVDVTTRGFMALTGACAQCHDHKFDPITTKDFYAMQGVFSSTKRAELELAPPDEVKRYKEQAKKVDELKLRIQEFLHTQATQLAEILASESPRYIRAARKVLGFQALDAAQVAQADGLDRETLQHWIRYLKTGPEENKYLHGWKEESFDLSHFRQEALAVIKERKAVDERNLAGNAAAKAAGKGKLDERTDTAALPTERWYLWRDLFFNDSYGKEFKQEEDGILYYGPNRGYLTSDGTIERFLEGPWKMYLAGMRAELNELQAALPPQYAFAHVIKDLDKPKNERIQINGQPDNLGEEAPRAFLSILCEGEPKPFQEGSGRRELAEAIASPTNPLTARVMVNRIWQHHFGEGLVRTVSNFGRMGETPSHPALLDYLASQFVESGWSMKKLHREIMLSAAYQLSSDNSAENYAVDADNRLLWRANRQRLDAEAMRDSLLAVTGELDRTAGGMPVRLNDEANHRRSIYGFVSRRKLDGTLALFDFPNPNLTAEKRISTATPLQQLFFLNSGFLEARAKALIQRIGAGRTPADGVREAYRLVFGRDAKPDELRIGTEFVAGKTGAWLPYAQVLLSSNELLFVN